MIQTDNAKTYARSPIEPADSERWWQQFALYLDPPAGMEIAAHGKLQFKCYEQFAVECRIGLFFEPGPVLASIPSPAGVLHPITGANTHPEVGDKYLVLTEQVYFTLPGPGFLVLRASARSTAAVYTSRIDFGNGLLQARY
jgi:hypothetical protein